MVPSDLKPSLQPARLASSVAVQGRVGVASLLLSAACFCKQRVFAPEGLGSSLPSGAGVSKRFFRSPMTTVRFRAAIMRSLFPDRPLQRLAGLSSGLAPPPCGWQRFRQFATEKLAFPNSPNSVAPRPVGTPPADLRSEFATASEAQRSSNLLEPIRFSHSGF